MSKHRWYDPDPSGRPSSWRQCVRCQEWNTSDEEDAECMYLDAYVVDAWMAVIDKHDAGHTWTSAQVVDVLRAISHGVEPKEAT